MNLWFKQILTYLVLVIFHLNSGQLDNQSTTCSRDQPASPPLALYHPPGAPFRPAHFTKYPPNPAYSEFNLEKILIADSLTRARETKTIGCKGKWYMKPPILFKDKYNYLPAYFVPMTLPLPYQPNHPLLVGFMVPNSRPWSLLGQSLSYIIKLALILGWALPIVQAVPHPESINASTYAWLPEIVYITVLGPVNQVMSHTGIWRPPGYCCELYFQDHTNCYMAFQTQPASPVRVQPDSGMGCDTGSLQGFGVQIMGMEFCLVDQ
ncbi:hypothetical protein DSO57_1022737 [Entomophthora muscae]|uniref:Uncharacterized protein n=1 Tax=Entomophthora muscae TaxID=34485 RepID=A0ACC2RU87_9FUNG|nr:hypothetical protein DSO57_1022737 [Entomophthora muscae]